MSPAIRTSRTAAAAFLSALLSLACGVLAFTPEADLFLAGLALFAVLAIILGVVRWVQVGRTPDPFRGNALLGWAVAFTGGGLALGFVLLPAT
jgi:hypothetical protein